MFSVEKYIAASNEAAADLDPALQAIRDEESAGRITVVEAANERVRVLAVSACTRIWPCPMIPRHLRRLHT